MRNRVFVNKPEGKRPPGRATSRRESNDTLYRKEIGREGEEWVELAQNLYSLLFSKINKNVAAVGSYEGVGTNKI